MIKKLILFIYLGCTGIFLFGQENPLDSLTIIQLDEVLITANRIPILLEQNPGAISLVNSPVLCSMPRSIAVDEALRLVPGVRIDNHANGSRVHMSVRGQGILSERGLRGIKVLIDGIPVNDPTGFASDLYDIDWPAVATIEVLRGPSASLYGCSSNAGILNITTDGGGNKPLNVELYGSTGSNGFAKGFWQVNGTADKLSYRISASGLRGDGYRHHTAFRGNNINEKLIWKLSEKVTVTQLFFATRYFNQNAEGLNLSQLDNPKQANPDAIPCNEYQKTQRIINGLTAIIKISDSQELLCNTFIRLTSYKEPGSSAVQNRNYSAPGASIQYSVNSSKSSVRNHFSIGADIQYQQIEEYKVPNIKDTTRTEKIGDVDESVIEGSWLLANQTIKQSAIGIFMVDRLELGERFNAILSIRYDNMKNNLTDKMDAAVDFSGDANFEKATARIGMSYHISDLANLYANIGQGFLPPATEELANNPSSFGGFNADLVPSISLGEEVGIRGNVRHNLYYDLTGFYMNTENDFYRYRMLPERPLETFYGNAGKTRRFGIETFVNWVPVKNIAVQVAYTFSDFKYKETSSDSMYTDGIMLPAIISGYTLPNSPKHQLYAEVEYKLWKHILIGLSTEYQSKWYIYTNKNVIQDGFNLYHARASYSFQIGNINANFSVYCKNLTGQSYIAFTEPDPDGNSYQPAAGREFFASLRIQL
jgi:iron complex outermembrane receptor protein